eukprot:8949378-Heterocapsa_arctica.AAC.1
MRHVRTRGACASPGPKRQDLPSEVTDLLHHELKVVVLACGWTRGGGSDPHWAGDACDDSRL